MNEIYIENKRIWEMDFLRGIAIFIMIFIHIPYMIDMFTDYEIIWSPFFYYLRKYGGASFIAISGVVCSFDNGVFKRGLELSVIAISLTCITNILYKLGYEEETILIEFGILHLIAFSMLIFPILKKCPTFILVALFIASVVIGYVVFSDIRFPKSILLIFGLRPSSYTCYDYFPILPNIGWFIFGMIFYKIFYEKNKKTIVPLRNYDNIIIRFFTFLGRKSIYIYLIHLPIIYILVRIIFKNY